MNRTTSASPDPWRAFVNVAQIPETGLHREIEAGPAVRAAMADIAGLREISSACASFEMNLRNGGRVHVAGHVRARIGQTCVVTLDPIENDIDEAIDLIFAPEAQNSRASDDVVEEGDASELFEMPEPIVNGVIDLGRLATDVLYLAIDPYPRKPGAVFEPPISAADPEGRPFAALRALRVDPKKPKSGRQQDE
jgi:hypothetical protein